MTRKPYPTDVSDAEWAFVAPYLTLMIEDAMQREHETALKYSMVFVDCSYGRRLATDAARSTALVHGLSTNGTDLR